MDIVLVDTVEELAGCKKMEEKDKAIDFLLQF